MSAWVWYSSETDMAAVGVRVLRVRDEEDSEFEGLMIELDIQMLDPTDQGKPRHMLLSMAEAREVIQALAAALR